MSLSLLEEEVGGFLVRIKFAENVISLTVYLI